MKAKSCCVVVALLFVACDAGSEAESKVDQRLRCVEERALLVEERLDGIEIDREQHRRALTDALGEAFIERCLAQHAGEEK